MTEENKSLQTPQNEPEPEAEPVDTAAAMQYFEASEAAAEVGREILASRKPKKQKQKKPKKKKSPVQQEPETAPAPEPVEEPAEQPAPEATETNGWQPSQREEPAAEPAAEPAPAEPQESPKSQEPKAPKKPKKKKKKSRPKQGKKAPAKAKNAKPREKRPTLRNPSRAWSAAAPTSACSCCGNTMPFAGASVMCTAVSGPGCPSCGGACALRSSAGRSTSPMRCCSPTASCTMKQPSWPPPCGIRPRKGKPAAGRPGGITAGQLPAP